MSAMRRLIRSFGFALAGLTHAFGTQQNFRIHAVITACVIAAGIALRVTATEWAVLAITIGVVMQAELFNTALEAIVDKVSPERHDLARIAKDCAAAAVVVSALAAVGVGMAIFGPRLLALAGLK
jgi:diacylglycerol kinase